MHFLGMDPMVYSCSDPAKGYLTRSWTAMASWLAHSTWVEVCKRTASCGKYLHTPRPDPGYTDALSNYDTAVRLPH